MPSPESGRGGAKVAGTAGHSHLRAGSDLDTSACVQGQAMKAEKETKTDKQSREHEEAGCTQCHGTH